jgi:hypothetical protein
MHFRYVDDILIMHDQNKTNIDHTLDEFNKLQPTINFTIEKEHESINFLDLKIYQKEKICNFIVYRKPTKLTL